MSEKRHPTWGELLEAARVARGIPVRTAAAACKITADEWTAIVTGEITPCSHIKESIYRTFRSMRGHDALYFKQAEQILERQARLGGLDSTDLMRALKKCSHTKQKDAKVKSIAEYDGNIEPRESMAFASSTSTASPVTPPDEAPANPPITPPVTPSVFGAPFHVALKQLRQADGISTCEIASLLSVHPSTPPSWESDQVVPIQEHYDKLVDLFPALATASRPMSRDIPKPGAPLGSGLTANRVPKQDAEQEKQMPPVVVFHPSLNESFRDGIRFAHIAGTIISSQDGARVLEMLQIAKQRGLSIDDVIASMQEAGR